MLALELAQNARTWATLQRLGVGDGTELALDFFYETEPDGVSGRTPPMPLSTAVRDEWVVTMLRSSREHGGCAFSGWTATVSRLPTKATTQPRA